MNFTRLRHKSLFYSLLIHIFIVLSVFALVYQVNKTDRNYSLVDLRSIDVCSPAMECFCQKEVKEVKAKQACAMSTAAVPPRKKQIENRPKPKSVVKKEVKLAKVGPMVVPKEVEAEINTEEETQRKEKKSQNKVEEERTEQIDSVQSSQENSPSSVVTSKPKVSYEARYIQDNLALINAMIKKNLSYPAIAKKRGAQGKVMVFFTLNVDGTLSDVQASGKVASILKKSAVKTIEKASSSFPPTQETLSLQIPIVYKLR